MIEANREQKYMGDRRGMLNMKKTNPTIARLQLAMHSLVCLFLMILPYRQAIQVKAWMEVHTEKVNTSLSKQINKLIYWVVGSGLLFTFLSYIFR